MTTRTPNEIDFSTFPESDGEPMAETLANQVQMVDLQFALRGLLRAQGRTQVAVGGNQFLYYNQYNGREHVSPDVYVALDVEPGDRPTWKTWVEGKCPDVVWEITSPSTQDEDVGHKRELYARLGVREYYIYDPQGVMTPRFQGYESRAGRLEPLPVGATGGIVSPLLGAELRPVGTYLRVIDPASGQPLLTSEETRFGFEAAREQLLQEEQARRVLREQLFQEEQARRVLREQLLQEEQARLAAEQRAMQAEAALQAALARLAQRHDAAPEEP